MPRSKTRQSRENSVEYLFEIGEVIIVFYVNYGRLLGSSFIVCIFVQLDEGVKTGHIYNIDEYKNENNLLEVYWACSKNVCRNGAKCFQRGKEIWCQCPKKYTGLLCEIKKADAESSCSCDNGTVRKLAVAFVILFVIFILFFIIAIVMYRKNVPWCRKKEKREWCEPVQQRLEDDWKIKEFLIKDIVKKPYKHGYDCRQPYETSSDTNCEIESQ